MLAAVSAFAQFEADKKYVGASLTSAGLSYSDTEDFAFGANAQAGYMIDRDWLAIGEVGLNYRYSDWQSVYVGARVRYFIEQNGLFLGCGARLIHEFKNFNDFQVTPEVGYCYFLNKTVTIEPSLYYDISLSDFAHKSKVGVKIGLGLFF